MCACTQSEQSNAQQQAPANVQERDTAAHATAYFAAGCFWCVEAIFESVRGVIKAESGYAGGTERHPTYEQVSSGQTSHAEAVRVYYDSTIIDFPTLLAIFFGSHDPTSVNRQGPDVGPQYRSVAFYQNLQERRIIEQHMAELASRSNYQQPLATQVVPIDHFWLAEPYHQDFVRNHPRHPYVLSESLPRLNRFMQKFPHLLKTEAKQ